MKKLLPIHKLKKYFYIDVNGIVYWKKRENTRNTWNTRFSDKPAGTLKNNGYIFITFDKKKIAAHRIVFALSFNLDPYPFFIDHIDGNPRNNKPSNLRLATNADNNRHQTKLNKNNKTGYRGVYLHSCGKFVAKLKLNDKSKYLGLFATAKEAGNAAKKFRLENYGDFFGKTL